MVVAGFRRRAAVTGTRAAQSTVSTASAISGSWTGVAVTIGRRGWLWNASTRRPGPTYTNARMALCSASFGPVSIADFEMVAPDPADRRLAQAGGIGDRACRPAAGRRFPQHARQSPVDHLVGCSGAAGSRCVGQSRDAAPFVALLPFRCGAETHPATTGGLATVPSAHARTMCARVDWAPAGFAATPSTWQRCAIAIGDRKQLVRHHRMLLLFTSGVGTSPNVWRDVICITHSLPHSYSVAALHSPKEIVVPTELGMPLLWRLRIP